MSYNGNGHESGKPPVSVSVSSGSRIPVAVNSGELTKSGHYFAGWNTQSDGNGNNYKPGVSLSVSQDVELYAQWQEMPDESETKTFYAVTTDGTWYRVDARKLAENDQCVVYGDMLENIFPSVAQAIADEYNAKIFQAITSAFGDIKYMPNNEGKLFLLLLDIQDGFTGSGGYVAGYFDSTHMYTDKYSNKAAMLFMDVYPGDPSKKPEEFYTVIAHELQHLINFSSGSPKDTWLNEGLSLAAEYIYGGEQNARIDYFSGKYGNTTIPYGNNFFVWDGYWEQQYGDILADYATAYLFFRWLGIHAGETIYREIVASNNSGYLAVTGAAANIDSTFADWKTLLGAWMLANYYQESTGFYGYKGEITSLKVSYLPAGGPEYLLFPGEGVFSKIPSSNPLSYTPTGNIHYIGLPTGNFSVSLGALLGTGPYTGQALLTFNGNTSEKGNYEGGYVASLSPAGPQTGRNTANRNVPGPIAVPPGKYPVSFGDMAEKTRRNPGY